MPTPSEKPSSGARISRRRLVCAVAGLFLGELSAGAQIHKRAVRGRVTDETGIPLKGAVVRIKNAWSFRVRSYIVQGDGVYRFRGLLPNVDYELKAKYRGATSRKKRLDRFDSRVEAVIDLKVDLRGIRS
jgi:hypothetical protein